MKLNKFSLFSFPLLRIIFICVVFITRFNIMSFIDEINHVLVGLNSNSLSVLDQFRVKAIIFCDHQTTSEVQRCK